MRCAFNDSAIAVLCLVEFVPTTMNMNQWAIELMNSTLILVIPKRSPVEAAAVYLIMCAMHGAP